MTIPNESITILVADDVYTNIEFLRYILRKEKYNILAVSNGAEALDAVEKNTVDLALLDVMMPDVDGFEVCKRMKANPRTSHIPIIFLTARTDVESTVKGFELGAVDYVTKPFHRQELLARLRTHIELQRGRETNASQNEWFEKAKRSSHSFAEMILDELDTSSPNLNHIREYTEQILRICSTGKE